MIFTVVKKKAMCRLARCPGKVSLAQLILSGCLSEDAVDGNGHVDEMVRSRAEATYEDSHPTQTDRAQPNRAQPNRSQTTRVHAIQKRSSPPALKKAEAFLCSICFTRMRSHVFIPCFHFHACKDCAEKCDACPICRRQYTHLRRVWY